MSNRQTGSPHAIVDTTLMKNVAAIGFFVYGGMYVLVGALAAKVAIGTGGRVTGPQGAILEVAREPFGGVLSFIIMIGLFAYSFWRLVQFLSDPEQQGRSAKGLFIRAGRLVSALAYGGLALFTLNIMTSVRKTTGGPSWAVRLVTEPPGAAVGSLVALVIVVVGFEQFRKAYTSDFGERLHESRMTNVERTGGHYAARLGFSARGVVFTMTGAYLLYAVFDANPHRAKSVDQLLLTLLRLPYGNWIMGVVALGLASYGLFMLLVAQHRKHPF